MLNSIEKSFISHLCRKLPERRGGKRGPNPIPKKVLIQQLFILFKTNCGWRNIKHSSTCRNYLEELQRRSKFKNFFNFLIQEFKKFRPPKTIVDSTDLPSFRTLTPVKYSGKYHNYCLKITVEFTPKYIPLDFSINSGTTSDSKILDQMLVGRVKLPYDLHLDKGYEKYERRRELKNQGCQVRMEMKKSDKSRKRGPRFKFTDQHKKQRSDIEKCFAWIKSFKGLKLNTFRKFSLIMAKVIICLSFIAFRALSKL